MDARERLKKYLEQRRELGDAELILETMTAAEAVGAARSLGRSSSSASWRKVLAEAGATETPLKRERPAPRTAPQPAKAEPMAAAPITGPINAAAGISIGSSATELFGGPFTHLKTLDEIASAVVECTRCPLYRTAVNGVPGEGNPNADLVCVGEAPGAQEDATGRPFIGQAGQLLTKILASVNLSRDEVFICNVIKHRPPGNRNPLPNEIEACGPYLVRQLELIRPKVILALGSFAAQTLLQTTQSIGKLRGFIHRYYGIPLVVTYHPAALLRNPAWKRPTWDDVKLARSILDRAATGA